MIVWILIKQTTLKLLKTKSPRAIRTFCETTQCYYSVDGWIQAGIDELMKHNILTTKLLYY